MAGQIESNNCQNRIHVESVKTTLKNWKPITLHCKNVKIRVKCPGRFSSKYYSSRLVWLFTRSIFHRQYHTNNLIYENFCFSFLN